MLRERKFNWIVCRHICCNKKRILIRPWDGHRKRSSGKFFHHFFILFFKFFIKFIIWSTQLDYSVEIFGWNSKIIFILNIDCAHHLVFFFTWWKLSIIPKRAPPKRKPMKFIDFSSKVPIFMLKYLINSEIKVNQCRKNVRIPKKVKILFAAFRSIK